MIPFSRFLDSKNMHNLDDVSDDVEQAEKTEGLMAVSNTNNLYYLESSITPKVEYAL